MGGNFLQDYSVNAGTPKILGPKIFLIFMSFLMNFLVILLSMLMILHSTLSVIRHLIYGNN